MHTGGAPLLIDLGFQQVPGVIASWLVKGDDGWAIVDCGPESCRAGLEAGVAAHGLEMGDITRIVLTHIHLDHGGGTGALLRAYPHLRVSVHRDAAGILVDPSRLVRSATMSYGDAMDTLWGEVVPVHASRIDPVVPGDTVPGTPLRAIATPGHTATHLGYLDTSTGVLFTGDAAHARLENSSVIVPTLSPVEVDIDAWSTTARAMRELTPSALALPHFGLVDDAGGHLALIEERIESRMRIAAGIVRTPDDAGALASTLAEATRQEFEAEGGDVETKIATMELCMPSWLGAQGILRWYKVHGKFQQA